MRYFIALILLPTTVLAGTSPSLCTQAEDVVFSCRLKRSTKVVSVCTSRDLLQKPNGGYVIYRFGEAGAVELEYPASRRNSPGQFSYYHYFRPDTDQVSLSFSNVGYRYVIHEDHDEMQTPAGSAGVSATEIKSGKTVTLECAGDPVAHWYRIDGAVACDDDLMSSCLSPAQN
ncbi:hypothetical protein [Aromatoleum petrolei]|uniref:Uncharacterized protein n=1 Tax=Aromatoleum petrolei TaxID=76116 RepID=A0ABX1MNF5_9RHOO|nr:hypothetical protein [Aromatoleum petrolei]NMF87881.1 hypothetical protein [Aromatoleum petrolei]QTQ35251.1 Uncharacterized protein ToN1_10820 [Aromatoleum petrolei]